MAKKLKVYDQIIEAIFFAHYKSGLKAFEFDREEIGDTASSLGLDAPKNPGDVVYSFRYREPLPEKIRVTEPAGLEWIIKGVSKGMYAFQLAKPFDPTPNDKMAETKILDATPGIISKYALDDEQALLAKIRYNRLVDIFTGLTCYSLQNHWRSTNTEGVQGETDEVYVGVDKRGVHYVLPVQAKGGDERLGVVQITQDFVLCRENFPDAICKSIGAQFLSENLIVMFEFELDGEEVKIVTEKHYKLVSSGQLTQAELSQYRIRTE